MKEIWEFYEELDDFVYVSDMDSYELVYLNKKSREAFGQDYKGKKCYELLQNCATPCSLCTNPRLVPGHFVKWNYYNPILDKHLLLVDTMLMENGRRYRFEIALDNDNRKRADRIIDRYENLEMKINNAIGIAVQKPSPDETIESLLEFLGNILGGERAYIFEKNENGEDDNTYEWVAAGVLSEKDNLQNVPPEVCAPWYRSFRKNQDVVIRNLEDIRETDPLVYQVLKPQNIHSLIVIPLYVDQKLAGFYGIDNPPFEQMDYASGMLHIMAHFIAAAIKRRDLVRQLQKLSYCDQLTGFGNRHALQEYSKRIDHNKSLGVLFCDITGLKSVNDTQGHKAGDQVILLCAQCLRKAHPNTRFFRLGGDELVAIRSGIEEKEMMEQVKRLQRVLSENGVNMSVGLSYAPKGMINLERMMSEAETRMYQDKALYYQQTGKDRRRN